LTNLLRPVRTCNLTTKTDSVDFCAGGAIVPIVTDFHAEFCGSGALGRVTNQICWPISCRALPQSGREAPRRTAIGFSLIRSGGIRCVKAVPVGIAPDEGAIIGEVIGTHLASVVGEVLVHW